MPRDLALAGVALALVGFGWSFAFLFIKALWTSSYVLYSTGLPVILLALCFWLFDRRQWRGVSHDFLHRFRHQCDLRLYPA